jgi:hypothetical protein
MGVAGVTDATPVAEVTEATPIPIVAGGFWAIRLVKTSPVDGCSCIPVVFQALIATPAPDCSRPFTETLNRHLLRLKRGAKSQIVKNASVLFCFIGQIGVSKAPNPTTIPALRLAAAVRILQALIAPSCRVATAALYKY